MLRASFASTAILLMLSGAFGCGSRTELDQPPPCQVEGEQRPCADDCGAGAHTCRNGLWTRCEVPVAVRACADDCGGGEQACRDGRWGECVVPTVERACQSVCGNGTETCSEGKWTRCDAPQPKPPRLLAVVRDFSPLTHVDFEAGYPTGLDEGIVERTLGADDKPVYAGAPRTKSTSGVATFDQWYRDVPGVNQRAEIELQLQVGSDGLFSYEDRKFFPIDGQLFGNEQRANNFHFTLEAATSFVYVGGETFSFSGDDDMWVFINRQLVIDLGGLHPTLSAEVSLDELAGPLRLERGQTYALHFFFAERHTNASNFTIRTSIADRGSCD